MTTYELKNIAILTVITDVLITDVFYGVLVKMKLLIF